MNTVDVVIPCYNYAKYLRQCVLSVLEQEGVEVRVLVIDDCSTDNTQEVGYGLAHQDSRVEFRHHSSNCGHISTYNEGLLGWAAAEYSLLLSADDALAPGALARATQLMEIHKEVGITYGLAQYFYGEENVPASAWNLTDKTMIVTGPEIIRRCFLHGNILETPTAVVRTSLQQNLGGYFADLPHSGDMEMWMRFAAHGSFGVVNSIQAYVRKHDNNMSYRYFGKLLRDKREVYEACERFYSMWGHMIPESTEWRKKMKLRMSEEACWIASNTFEQGDMGGFHDCLDFAKKTYPGIRTSSIWWRLQLKRLLGPKILQKIRPVLNKVKNTGYIASGSNIKSPVTVTGWWPG